MRHAVLLLGLLAGAPLAAQTPAGRWRAQLDLAGGPLRFHLDLDRGVLCNGGRCDPLSTVERLGADSVLLGLADYAAAIRARVTADSLVGYYHNVGNRGPRTIPFRATAGAWPVAHPGEALVGRWDATFTPDTRPSPRVLVFRDTPRGLEGTIISNTGDYGLFWGGAARDSFAMAHFDGSFVYMLTGALDGDTLRGIFHAGLRSQYPFKAVRSTGDGHLTPPDAVVRVERPDRYAFAFPGLDGRFVTSDDPRFDGKVVLVEIFGTWCPTCHDAAGTTVELYERYHDRGLEVVGLAYEVTGDPDIDGPLVARYRDKFGIRYPLLLAGVNDDESPNATQPQLDGPIAFPTTIFLDRSGRVRRVHSGFYGPATGAAHEALRRDFFQFVEELLAEPAPNR